MTEPKWETVEVPRGAYISWGNRPGVQGVIGQVVDYQPQGGTDFAGNSCPQLSLELRQAAYSVNKNGERTDHAVGDLVVLNAGLVSLKRAIQAAALKPGDLVKILYARDVSVDKGTVKEFDIQVARGAGQVRPPQARQPQPEQSRYQQAPPQQARQQAPQGGDPWAAQPQPANAGSPWGSDAPPF